MMISCIAYTLKNSPYEFFVAQEVDSDDYKNPGFRVPQRTINLVLITLAQVWYWDVRRSFQNLMQVAESHSYGVFEAFLGMEPLNAMAGLMGWWWGCDADRVV